MRHPITGASGGVPSPNVHVSISLLNIKQDHTERLCPGSQILASFLFKSQSKVRGSERTSGVEVGAPGESFTLCRTCSLK